MRKTKRISYSSQRAISKAVRQRGFILNESDLHLNPCPSVQSYHIITNLSGIPKLTLTQSLLWVTIKPFHTAATAKLVRVKVVEVAFNKAGFPKDL